MNNWPNSDVICCRDNFEFVGRCDWPPPWNASDKGRGSDGLGAAAAGWRLPPHQRAARNVELEGGHGSFSQDHEEHACVSASTPTDRLAGCLRQWKCDHRRLRPPRWGSRAEPPDCWLLQTKTTTFPAVSLPADQCCEIRSAGDLTTPHVPFFALERLLWLSKWPLCGR